MSWTAEGTIHKGVVTWTHPAPELDDAGVEEFERAKTSAADIIFSGVLGDPDAKYDFAISGASDALHVTVSLAREQ